MYSEMLLFPSMEGKTENAENFLTVDDAAQLVCLSHWTVRSWLHKGLLTRYKSGSRTVVNRSELLELLKPKKVHRQEMTWTNFSNSF